MQSSTKQWKDVHSFLALEKLKLWNPEETLASDVPDMLILKYHK